MSAPPGYGKTEQLGDLVEGFAGGIVDGPAEGPVASDAVDPIEMGMAAGDRQGQIRERQLPVPATIARICPSM